MNLGDLISSAASGALVAWSTLRLKSWLDTRKIRRQREQYERDHPPHEFHHEGCGCSTLPLPQTVRWPTDGGTASFVFKSGGIP